MTVTWPTTPDTLPKPTSATYADDAGYLLDDQLANYATLLERLESVASGELFINGNYDWWQRIEAGTQTCTTTFNAITSFGPDRMFTLPVGASVNVSRNTGVPTTKSRFSAGIGGAASVTTVDHGQRIRSAYRTLYTQSLIFSAYVHNLTGAAFTPTLRIDTPAAADDWTTPTNRGASTLQSCADSAWTQVWAVVNPSAFTNINNGMSAYLRIPSGSMVAGDLVLIAQMSLRPGVALVPYLSPDPAAERLRCLPYYRKSYSEGVALQTDTTVGLVGAAFFGSGATNVYMGVPFGMPMWKIPTCRVWDKAGTANQFYKLVAATNHSAAAVTQLSTNGFTISSSTTSTEDMWVHFDAVSELT